MSKHNYIVYAPDGTPTQPLTYAQVCERLKISPEYLDTLVQRGIIECALPDVQLFNPFDIINYILNVAEINRVLL